MATKINTALILGLTLLLAAALAAQEKPEDIPDAPSATRPIPPPAPPSPRQEAAEESKPDVPPADGSGVTTGSKELPIGHPGRSVGDASDTAAGAAQPAARSG